VRKWYEDLKKPCGNIPVILFGNKIDLLDGGKLNSNPNIPTSDAIIEQSVKDNRLVGYYKSSVLTGQGVNDAFKVLVKELYMVAKISSLS
jgi:GTPase SAR1 family protein